MRFARIPSLLFITLLLGAGCTPTGPGSLASLKIPVQNVPKNGAPAIPCLAFSIRDGFTAWVDQYEKGTDAAHALSRQIHLPDKADARVIANIRASLQPGVSPSFVCTLSDDGKDVAWVVEPEAKNGAECRDKLYVTVDGKGTTSEITSTGRTVDCTQLCKPKRFEKDLLVWQCDLRTDGAQKSWSQMNMNRATGDVEIVKCQKDALGLPSGCIE